MTITDAYRNLNRSHPMSDTTQKHGRDAVSMLIQCIGDDPSREGVADTPARVVRSWETIFGGYGRDPGEVLKTTFAKDGFDEIVLCRDIELYSTCEHHMLPFFGRAHVAYLPGERVVGLSKLARLVDLYARRLQIQERLTTEIADALEKHLAPRGVFVMIEAKHFCMMARGVGKQNSVMTTTVARGLFLQADTRAEVLSLIQR